MKSRRAPCSSATCWAPCRVNPGRPVATNGRDGIDLSGIDLFKIQCRCVAGTKIHVASTHLRQRSVALVPAREPVLLLPVFADEETERVIAPRTNAQAEGSGLGQRLPQV